MQKRLCKKICCNMVQTFAWHCFHLHFFPVPGDVTWFNMKLLEQAIYYKSIKPCEETLKCRTNFSKPFFITRLWRFQIWHLHSHKLNEQREGNWGSNMKTIDSIATVDKRCALHFIFNRCLPSSCEVAMQNPHLQPLVINTMVQMSLSR